MQKRMVQSGVRLAQLALARLAAGVSGWLWVWGLYASAAGLQQRVIAVRQHDRALGGSVGSVGACPCERWRCARPRTSGTPDGPHRPRPGRRAQRAFDSARPRPSRPGHARVHAPRPSAPHCWCRRAPPSCPSREASAPRDASDRAFSSSDPPRASWSPNARQSTTRRGHPWSWRLTPVSPRTPRCCPLAAAATTGRPIPHPRPRICRSTAKVYHPSHISLSLANNINASPLPLLPHQLAVNNTPRDNNNNNSVTPFAIRL